MTRVRIDEYVRKEYEGTGEAIERVERMAFALWVTAKLIFKRFLMAGCHGKHL